MIRFKRRNTAWLVMLGTMVGLALLSPAVAPNVQFTLATLLVVAVVASFVELSLQRVSLVKTLRRASRGQTRISPQAREAADRARRRGGFFDERIMLVDVGLIALQAGQDGIVMRRTRSTSKDDDGIRPFITLNVDPDAADRAAVIRFEIVDHSGQEQYIHEMRTYLHDGEMNILADHHLPLAGNQHIAGTGDWDLRVYIDGALTAMHSFMLAPSLDERQNRLTSQQRLESDESVVIESEDVPVSLEDLLRSRSSSGRRSR